MTPGFGIGMFVFGMGCILVGAVIAFFIIKEVTKERKKPTRFDDLERYLQSSGRSSADIMILDLTMK